MRQRPQAAFTDLGVPATCSQGRAEDALTLRECALDLPTLPEQAAEVQSLHRTAIGRPRPAAAGIPAVQSDGGLGDAQSLTAESVIVLAIVTGVAKQSVPAHSAGRRGDGFTELRRVLTRPLGDHDRDEQVATRVADRRQLGPAEAEEPPVPRPQDVRARGVTALEAGCVDGGFRLAAESAEALGARDDGGKESCDPPFFKRRISA